MKDLRQAAQQALEALEAMQSYAAAERKGLRICDEAILALRAALAEPEQEPVAWADMDVRGEDKGLSWTPGHFHKTPLYTAPTPRKPLTDEELEPLCDAVYSYDITNYDLVQFARAIERSHGIGEQHDQR